jgi:two-component system response regulator HydG
MITPTTLLVCSDPTLVDTVCGVIEHTAGFGLEVVADLDAACNSIVGHEQVSVVVVHLKNHDNVAGASRLLQTINDIRPSVVTLVIAEELDPEQVLALLRLGVADCLSRPLDLNRLAYLIKMLTIESRYGVSRPEAEVIETEADSPCGRSAFFRDRDGRMGRTIEQILRIAPKDTTILLGGETGTGKTRLAGVIHKLSLRRDKPLLSINCGALAANLIESEMFGHVRGAFTGAAADRIGKFAAVGSGTIFLDEIDALPMELQAKLLRVVEERAFEPVGSNKTLKMQARLIVASNRSLAREVEAGRFRADLFYRLNVAAFDLAPLRERKPLIPTLARSFIAEFATISGQRIVGITDAALQVLVAHSWPGNIRELRNVIERAVVLCNGPMIGLNDLPETLQQIEDPLRPPQCANESPEKPRPSPRSLAERKDQAECECIHRTLLQNGNNRLRAAEALGISRKTLYKKLHKYGMMGNY